MALVLGAVSWTMTPYFIGHFSVYLKWHLLAND